MANLVKKLADSHRPTLGDKESLEIHQMFTPAPEEYIISTPVSVPSSAAMAVERLKLAQQELLREGATREKTN